MNGSNLNASLSKSMKIHSLQLKSHPNDLLIVSILPGKVVFHTKDLAEFCQLNLFGVLTKI